VGHWHDVQAELREPAKSLRGQIPDVLRGYAELHRAAMASGELSTGMKELIALALAVAEQCDGCIAAHARGAQRAGVSPGQVAEALGVAIMMTGGPGTVYAPRAWEAFAEFEADYREPGKKT